MGVLNTKNLRSQWILNFELMAFIFFYFLTSDSLSNEVQLGFLLDYENTYIIFLDFLHSFYFKCDNSAQKMAKIVM